MGSSVSRSGKGKLSLNLDRVTRRKKSSSKTLKLDVTYMSRAEVEDILSESSQKTGSYILYEDLDKQKMFLALKRTNGQVSHHFIHCYNDLYYFDDFPFPYVESIILYYSKHKFKDTKFTQQACLDPFLSTGHKSVRRQLADNRRCSGSTNSGASSCKVQQKTSFRKVDPDHNWVVMNVMDDYDICENEDCELVDYQRADYPKKKTLVASTPNIMFNCEYNSLNDPTTMYLPSIVGRYDYQESNADSIITPESQFSSRVTIDSDSGYAVSVSNNKTGIAYKDRRPKRKPHVNSSFRILSSSNDNLIQSVSKERGLLEPPLPMDLSYTTRL